MFQIFLFPKAEVDAEAEVDDLSRFFHQLDRLDIPAAATVSARIVTKTTLTRLIRLYFSIYSCYSIPPFDHLTNFRSIFNGISLNF